MELVKLFISTDGVAEIIHFNKWNNISTDGVGEIIHFNRWSY